MEMWKDIVVYEGRYQISNMGRVKSLNYRNTNKECIMHPTIDDGGYLAVIFYIHSKPKRYRVHRLVATAFLDNSDILPQINHIDADKTNNKTTNLEWCTSQQNIRHALDNGLCENMLRAVEKQKKAIIATNIVFGIKMRFDSINEACRVIGCNVANVSKVLHGKHKSAYGYTFQFA